MCNRKIIILFSSLLVFIGVSCQSSSSPEITVDKNNGVIKAAFPVKKDKVYTIKTVARDLQRSCVVYEIEEKQQKVGKIGQTSDNEIVQAKITSITLNLPIVETTVIVLGANHKILYRGTFDRSIIRNVE